MNRIVLEHELQRLAVGGVVTPERVIESAQPESSPMHGEFEWNDQAAGHQHRLDQARNLIRTVRLVIRTTTVPFTSVSYVRDATAAPNQQGYVALREMVDDFERSSLTIDAELVRLNAMVQRVREIASVLGQQDRVAQYLTEIAGLVTPTVREVAA